MLKCKKIILSGILALLLGNWGLTPIAAQEAGNASSDESKNREEEVIKVSFPISPGLNEVYEDGTYGGLVYDWLHEIAKYTGWQYEFVTGDPDTLLTEFMSGENDIMGGMYYYEG